MKGGTRLTIRELYNYGKKHLPEPEESLILCEELFGFSRKDIIMKGDTNIENTDDFFDAIERRNHAEPLQYILGVWEFDDMKLTVKKGVLVPREDTIIAVEELEQFAQNNKLFGLDLCSGTGAIALSCVNRCKNLKIEAIELYDIPFACLNENVNSFGHGQVSTKKTDIFTAFCEYSQLDFIISNPPYIETREIPTLQIEVQNEPHTALDGGLDGLDFYKVICEKWSKCLKLGGFLCLEIGETQANSVSNLMLLNGFSEIKISKDWSGHDRVVSGIYSPNL